MGILFYLKSTLWPFKIKSKRSTELVSKNRNSCYISTKPSILFKISLTVSEYRFSRELEAPPQSKLDPCILLAVFWRVYCFSKVIFVDCTWEGKVSAFFIICSISYLRRHWHSRKCSTLSNQATKISILMHLFTSYTVKLILISYSECPLNQIKI